MELEWKVLEDSCSCVRQSYHKRLNNLKNEVIHDIRNYCNILRISTQTILTVKLLNYTLGCVALS
jgi:hypothetical protein